MRITCSWNDGLAMTAVAGEHSVRMDAKPPLGSDTGLTPKEQVLAGLCGCTGMDVVSLLKKYRQPLERLQIQAEAPLTESHPIQFKEVSLKFMIGGPVEPAKAVEAVTLSQTRYCGVSAMLSRAVPIRYVIELNGRAIGEGNASFGS